MVYGTTNREIVINSKFRYLEGVINTIPDEWEHLGKTIYKARNEIKVITHEGFDINVKSYQIPHFVNKFAYAYLRDSKAKRNYHYAHKLQNMSVATPEPIAYINCYEQGGLKNSFFVSVHLSDYPMTIRDVIGKEIEDKERILRQFTRFTHFSLLRNSVHHLDYSAGNILIKEDEYMYQFSIVDINRMRFEKMGKQSGLQVFSKLWAEEEELGIIGDEYAKITNQNPQEIINRLIILDQKHKNNVETRNKYKKRLKKK